MSDEEQQVNDPTLTGWFVAAFQIGLFSFGGGLAAWMLREFVVKRRWMTEAQFMGDLAVARVFPGTNVSNMIVISGYRLCGPAGVVAGLLGILSGPFLVVIALVQIYDRLSGPILDKALEGAAAAALGLLAFVVVKSLKHIGRRWPALCVIAAITVAILLFHAPLLPLILITLPISIFMNALDMDRA